MFAFKDFVPQRLRRQGFIKPPLYETFQEAVTAANVWVREQEVTVINIETVVLPALWNKNTSLSGAGRLNEVVSAGYATRDLYQFVRVWYKSE